MHPIDIIDGDREAYEGLPQIVSPLLLWFSENARPMPWRENPDPYWIWISEIMLQQTRVEAALGYFHRFIEALPTVESLAAVPEDELLKLWEGLGYYNRARNLKKTAKILVRNYDGRLPENYEELLKLPGIGPYTAGAIASNVYGLTVPAVDGNVYRVIARLLSAYTMITHHVAIQRAYASIVQEILPPECPGTFNQALMELGATVCIPNGVPRCHLCPLSFACKAKEYEIAEELPVRPSKKPKTKEERTIVVVRSPQGILLRKRPPSGLLASLWEPVNLEGQLTKSEVSLCLTKKGFVIHNLTILKPSLHIFSHIEWQMNGFEVWVHNTKAPDDYQWVSDVSAHSIPSAFDEFYVKTSNKERRMPNDGLCH